MNHELKVWPEFYKALENKTKQFEVRKNDRDFKVGDNLILLEFEPCENCKGTGKIIDLLEHDEDCNCPKPHGKFTGNRCDAVITYILSGGQFGIDKEYVVLSISVSASRKVYK